MSGNDSNRIFYNAVPLDVFQSLTKQGGFDECIDLELIEKHIATSGRIMEVGAGYGRCVDFLLKNKQESQILAVEQSPQLSKVLLEKYKNQPKVQVINADIKTLDVPDKMDVVLWLFSGMLDFGKEEQPVVMKRLRSFLKENGKLFIDIPQLAELTVAKYTSAQDIVMETPYGNITTFLPSFNDMETYASQAGFSLVSVIHYNTSTEKKRSIYMLEV
ncbi:MAG: class I SAM-dependent methyltransferase [Cytophagaceae bacterium]|nr:class I SAM-dependent methyltransferase [Cytophagaceae bacterium]